MADDLTPLPNGISEEVDALLKEWWYYSFSCPPGVHVRVSMRLTFRCFLA